MLIAAIATNQAYLQSHSSGSVVVDIMIGLLLLALWLNWKIGLIQGLLNALGDNGRTSVFAAFFVFSPILLDIGLNLEQYSTLLGPVLSAVVALTVREVFAYQRGREEIRSEIIVELMSNARNLNNIVRTIQETDSKLFHAIGLDRTWPKSLNIIWKNAAMKKHFTKAVAQGIFSEDALRRAEDRYSILEILAFKAEAGIPGYNDYNQVLNTLRKVYFSLIDSGNELGSDSAEKSRRSLTIDL
jgi:hypothetical protein